MYSIIFELRVCQLNERLIRTPHASFYEVRVLRHQVWEQVQRNLLRFYVESYRHCQTTFPRLFRWPDDCNFNVFQLDHLPLRMDMCTMDQQNIASELE
jgi:hypothetical protein